MIMFAAIRSAKARGDAVGRLGKAEKLRLPLDADTERLKPLDQKLLGKMCRKG
jgi:hypothetical protein